MSIEIHEPISVHDAQNEEWRVKLERGCFVFAVVLRKSKSDECKRFTAEMVNVPSLKLA